MIRPFKNRAIHFDRPISVYRNLTLKCWSIKQGGVVVAHADSLQMTSEKFKVNLIARDRGLTEGKKYVHAFIVGFLEYAQRNSVEVQEGLSVSYNPDYAGHFYLNRGGYKFLLPSERKINLKMFLTGEGKVLLCTGQDVIRQIAII